MVALAWPDRWPDFVIEHAEPHRRIYVEYLGRLKGPETNPEWKQKLLEFQSRGILPIGDGGGSQGSLIAIGTPWLQGDRQVSVMNTLSTLLPRIQKV